MQRKEWKRQAETYRDAAVTLLAAGNNDVAYHVAGLALECALKARIARSFKASTIPDKKFVLAIYCHDLSDLVRSAGLTPERERLARVDASFARNWKVVKDWSVDSRYAAWTAAEANDMVRAMTERRSGVLPWIRRFW